MPGKGSNPWIKQMWAKLKGGLWFWTTYGGDDSLLPWCGAMLAQVMTESGLPYPQNYARASAWADWGRRLKYPSYGCVIVFTRQGGGHVGLYVGEDETHYHVLGGNQSDSVNITRIAKARATAFRWPETEPLPERGRVLLASNGTPISHNEA